MPLYRAVYSPATERPLGTFSRREGNFLPDLGFYLVAIWPKLAANRHALFSSAPFLMNMCHCIELSIVLQLKDPLGLFREEKGISCRIWVSTSLRYDLSCWNWRKIPSLPAFPPRPGKKYCLFPVTVRKKNRVGRSTIFFFLDYFLFKNACFMHVLCWFGVGRAKKFQDRVFFLSKNLLG